MIEDCTAIILAGGDSIRMGFDKANLRLGGRTLLQHVSDTMQQIFPQIVISVKNNRPETGLPQVSDDLAGKEAVGPLAGVLAGLERITTPWAFVVACDMPYISPNLIANLATMREGYQAIVPVAKGYPQTLAAFYEKSCAATIRDHIEKGGKKSVRAVLEKLHVRYVQETEVNIMDPELKSFLDLDTLQDFKIAENKRS